MKTLALILGLLAISTSGVRAEGNFATKLMLTDLSASIASELHINNAINWKVGEFSEYDMKAMFGSLGTMKKQATSEQGNAIWIKEQTSGMMGNKTIEILIDRADGHIVEYREDGQKKDMPDQKLEIISQEHTSVTVPAGTFEAIHITAKTEQVKKLEIWANPRDITLDGTAKMAIDTGMLPVTVELTKFGGK